MRLKHITLFALCLLCMACKKEIDIDYHEVAPRYVVESCVTNKGMEAAISMTNNISDNTIGSKIDHAVIVVTGSDGSTTTLPSVGYGRYKAEASGTPGVEYTIDIELDGHHFTSSSVMQKMPVVNDFYFIRKDIMKRQFQMAKLLIQDIPNEENFYLTQLFRNYKSLKLALKKDDTNPDGELQQLFTFGELGSDDEDLLQEGDIVEVEVRTIDRKGYDYFYSLGTMDNTGSNPLPNFTGDCLGYFSAYSVVTLEREYHEKDLREEE